MIIFRNGTEERRNETDRICKGPNCQSERKKRFAQLIVLNSAEFSRFSVRLLQEIFGPRVNLDQYHVLFGAASQQLVLDFLNKMLFFSEDPKKFDLGWSLLQNRSKPWFRLFLGRTFFTLGSIKFPQSS